MRSRLDSGIAWTMPVVLIVVALHQVALAHARDLTPWKGGGFGMFASVDRLNYRAVHGTFVTEAGDIPFDVHALADVGGQDAKSFTNARGLLDDRRGRRLALVVAETVWTVEGDVARRTRPLEPGEVGPLVLRRFDGVERAVTVDAIRLEVFKATHPRGSGAFVPEPAGEFVLALRDG